MMYYVYILQNPATKKLYKGFTTDLRRWVREHNTGKTQTTRGKGMWRLVYYEAFKDEKDARREERFLKSGTGRERIKYLLQNTREN